MAASPHVPWELEPPLPTPVNRKRKKSYRSLDLPVIDALCDAMDRCYFESKAVEELGFHKDALMKWKRAGRDYRDECIDKDVEPDRRDPRYLDLYLLYRVTRKKAELRGPLWTAAYMSAIGRPARFMTDDKGSLERDEKGQPIKLSSEVKPNPKIALKMLAIADSHYADKSRLILTGQIDDEEDDGDRPTDFKIEVVRSRPEPERPPEPED